MPAAVNTSFNIRGEPIVCTLEGAFLRCSLGSEIAMLVHGRSFLVSETRSLALREDCRASVEAN